MTSLISMTSMTSMISLSLLAGALLAGSTAAASTDPVLDFILAADAVQSDGGNDAVAAWLVAQPDLTGAAVARLIDMGIEVGDAGNPADEAGNLVLAEALAAADAVRNPNSSLSALIAEYRAWDPAARAQRGVARADEEEAWASRTSDPARALELLTTSDATYAQIADSHSRARIFGRIGVAHWYLGDTQAVLDAYTTALERRRQVQDRMLEGATLNGLGSAQLQLVGDVDAAADWYRQAIELRRSIGDATGLATSLTYLANAETQRGRVVEARKLYEEARPVLEGLDDPTALVENLSGTANLYERTNRPADAIRLYTEAAELCQAAEDCGFAPLLLVERASAQLELGQLRAALASLESAEQLLADAPDPATAARLWQTRALTSMELGEQNAAREQMVTALGLARDSGDPAIECDGLVLLSSLYLRLGATDRARTSAEEALTVARDLADTDLERAALVALGQVDLETGQATEAAAGYSAALAIDESRGAQNRVAEDLVARGGAYSRLGRSDEARSDLRRAARMFSEAGRESLRWIPLLNLADGFEESDPDSAAWYYDQALTALEQGSDLAGGEAVNTGYLFAQRGHAYEEIIRYYAGRHAADPKAGWDAKAFETAERSRARGLLELIEDSYAVGATARELALIDSLYQVDAASMQGRADRTRLQNELATLRSARRADSNGLGTEPATLAKMFEEKPGQTLVLQYSVGDSASWLWIIDRKGSELHELPARAELRRRVRSFRDAIAQPGTADAVVLSEGQALYQILLAAAESRVKRRENVLIVPDDVLFELPFEALLMSAAPEGTDWSDQPFFGRDQSIFYAPSSTVYLALLQRGETDYDHELLAVGDPDYSGLSKPLEPLPWTRTEVEQIGARLKPREQTLLLGAEVTEPEFKTLLRLDRPRVLHLATHGLIDPGEPLQSCIALAPAGSDDGYLYTMEILSLHLVSPMVVLSACDSARGRLDRGEGVVGLTRSFLAAGARGVVASLWPVSDASTAALMTEFYGDLWRHTGAAPAMRQARRAMLKTDEWSHPYFWAAFVVIGTEKMPW